MGNMKMREITAMEQFMVGKYFSRFSGGGQTMVFVKDMDSGRKLLGKGQIVGRGDHGLVLLPQLENKIDQPGQAARVESDGRLVQ